MRVVDENTCTHSIAFCVSARTGLGHLRRVTNIAAAMRRIVPGVRMTLLANASLEGLSDAEQQLFSHTNLVDRESMARTLAADPPDVIAVDTAVIPDLELLPQPLALILRETMTERLGAFRLPAERKWDDVIVAEPANVWTARPEVIGAKRTTNVGWIYRTPDHEHALIAHRKGKRTLLIATGGGGTSDTLIGEIAEIIGHLRARLECPLHVVQVLGPRAPRAAIVADVDEVADVGSNLDRAFADADAVISTSGYNSILELAATTTPAVLCAISRTYDDQTARAAAWSDTLGIAHETGAADRTAQWLATVLVSGRRRLPAALGPSGSDQAAHLLAGLVQVSRNSDRALFNKSARGIAPATTAARARALFKAGVPTPQALAHLGTGHVALARIEGTTAAEDWRLWVAGDAQGGADSPDELASSITKSLAALHCADSLKIPLATLDPWRRIVPRLADGSAASAALDIPTLARTGRLAAELRGIAQRITAVPPQGTIVHGDFHLGQMIRRTGRDGYVIVDLDDLAIGARESDIGNCIAHIATSPMLSTREPGAAIASLSPIFIHAYNRHTPVPLDPRLVELHCGIALLRRVLKLAERGDTARLAVILEAVAAIAEHLSAQTRRAPLNETAQSRPAIGIAPAAERGRPTTCAS